MIYCQKQVLLFTFYLIFGKILAENEETALNALFDTYQKQEINVHDTSKQNSFSEQEGSENEKDYEGFISGSLQKQHKKLSHVESKGPKLWDQWGKWSSCSVSCGTGKTTRWRHCISGGCANGEKEAQIKTCSLPVC